MDDEHLEYSLERRKANEEHLEKLKEGVTEWNAWRDSSDEKPNLCSAYLYQADLSHANLSYANLRHADLRHANLSHANLSFACLGDANLCGANLCHADLTNSYVRDADLSLASLSRANLGDADLNSAYLYGAEFEGARFDRAKLHGANLQRADLSGADLSGAWLSGTIFADTDLSTTRGLPMCSFAGPSTVDHLTLERSGKLPGIFLRGCGFSDVFIDYIPTLFGAGGIEFFSCFISHSSADKAFAKRLYEALQSRGIRCWLDEKEILPGDNIHREIDHGIKQWDKTILCCSESALTERWWVDLEIEKAQAKEQRLQRERKAATYALIPLDVDGHLFSDACESPFKDDLLRRSVADFKCWKDHEAFERALDPIAQTLRADGGRKPPPPEQKL